jgi:hypothetical protein
MIKARNMEISTIEVTIATGQTANTATVARGVTVVGMYPSSNQDQFVDSVAVSGTTLTVTLAAAATADNKFKITLLN